MDPKPHVSKRFFGICPKHNAARTPESRRYRHTLGLWKPLGFRLMKWLRQHLSTPLFFREVNNPDSMAGQSLQEPFRVKRNHAKMWPHESHTSLADTS